MNDKHNIINFLTSRIVNIMCTSMSKSQPTFYLKGITPLIFFAKKAYLQYAPKIVCTYVPLIHEKHKVSKLYVE